MGSVVELLDVECVLFKFNNGSLIIVNIAVVWCREYCNNHWEFLRAIPFMHFISIKLGLVGSQDGEKFIFMKELICGLLPEEVGTASHVVLLESLRTTALFVLDWI